MYYLLLWEFVTIIINKLYHNVTIYQCVYLMLYYNSYIVLLILLNILSIFLYYKAL